LKKYFSKKISTPLLSHLKSGMSVEKVSLTLALGICIGIIPVLGVSTILLTIIALVLRLNIPAIQLVNYGIAVVKYALFVPFLKLGQIIFFRGESHIQFKNILSQYHEDFFGTFKTLWHLNLGGFIVWAIIAVPLGILIYHKSQPFFKLRLTRAIA
jgi:uncharacterized protein (DUF2062 family)